MRRDSLARTSSRALFILATMWNRSRMCRASEHLSRMSFRYGSHMSEQMKTILEAISSPMTVKYPWKDSMVLSLPTQSRRGDVQVDLVNQRQVFVPFGVLDLIATDGVDLAEHPVLQAPGDHVFDRIEDLVPRSAKRLGRFLPGQPACPASQEQHIRFGQAAFAVTPRNLFHHDRLAAAAIDAPHRVQQKDQKAPERNELEASFGQLIVSGGGLMAARTNRLGTLAWPHGDFNALVIGAEASLLINESPKAVT